MSGDKDDDSGASEKGLKSLLIETLRGICNNDAAPAAAKAQAARTLAEIAGLIGKHAEPLRDDDTPGAELSETELDKQIADLKRHLAET